MKTKIANPKKELLIGAGLDVLHQESREWQETIAFWKDETKFFADLLAKKESKESEYGKMLKNIDKIHANLFDYLANDIVSHEKFLSRLEKGEKGLSDENYREQHRKLNERMELFSEDFKDFKRMVFGYAKKL
tara:strand:- start:87607 stop:88005 length:399 start_codon:yes stop_codon:yes gene_type:complete